MTDSTAPKPNPRKRSIGKKLLIGLAAVLAILLLVLVVVLFWIGTDSGKSFVSGKIVDVLTPMFPEGDVSIGSTSVSVLGGSANVESITIKDRKNEIVAQVESINVDIDLGSLASDKIVIPKIHIVIGSVDIPGLLAEHQGSDDPGPNLLIEDLRVTGGPILYEATEITSLEVAARIEMAGDDLFAETSVFEVEAKPGPDLPQVSLRADTISFQKETAEIFNLTIASSDLGKSEVEAEAVRYNTATGELEFKVAANILKSAMPDIFAFATISEQLPKNPADIKISLQGGGNTNKNIFGTLLLESKAGNIKSDFSTNINTQEFILEGELSNVALSRFSGLLPASKISAFFTAQGSQAPSSPKGNNKSVRGKGETRTDIKLGAWLTGEIAGLPLQSLHLGATLKGKHVAASLTLASDKGGAMILADIGLPDSEDDDEIEINFLHAHAGDLIFRDIKTKPPFPIVGRLDSLEIRAKGTARALKLAVIANGTRLGFGDFATKLVSLNASANVDVIKLVEAKRLPERGNVQLKVTDLTQKGELLGSLSLAGDVTQAGKTMNFDSQFDGGSLVYPLKKAKTKGTIRATPKGFDLSLASVRARVLESLWKTSGNVFFNKDSSIDIQNLKIQSRAADILVNAKIPSNGIAPSGTVEVKAIDFSEFDAVLPNLPEGLTGTGKGLIAIQAERRSSSAALDFAFENIQVNSAVEPLDASVSLIAKDKNLSANIAVTAEGGGKIDVTVDSRGPRDPLNVEYWQRTGLANIRKATLDIVDFPLDEFIAFGVEDTEATGMVNAAVSIGDRGKDLDATFNVDDAGWNDLQGFSADMKLRWDEVGLNATAAFLLDGQHAIDARVEQDIPFDLALTQPDKLQTSPVSAQLIAQAFDLSRISKSGLVPMRLGGRLDVDATLSGRLSSGIQYDLRSLKVSDLVVDDATIANLEVTGKGDANHGTVSLSGSQRDGGTISGELVLGLRPTFVIEKGKLMAKNFNLAVLQAFATDSSSPLHNLAGRLTADFSVSGDPASPDLKGRVQVAGGRVFLADGIWQFSEINLSVYIEDKILLLERFNARAGDGEISAAGRAKLGKFLPEELLLELRTEKFPIARSDMRFEIDALATLTGEPKKEGFDGVLQINRSKIIVIRGGDDLQELGDLEDVVFIDEQAKSEILEAETPARYKPIRVAINTKRPIEVESKNEAKLRLNVDLKLLLEDLQPTSLVGSVNVIDGTVKIFDQAYEMTLGRITFDGPMADPNLEIGLAHDFPTSTVRVALDGPVSRLRIDLSDDAGHDQLGVLAIMSGQDPDDEDTKVEGGEFVSAVGNVIGGSVRSYLPAEIIDVLRFSTQGVVVGKWVLPSVLALYQFRSLDNQSRGNRHEGTLEWHILRHLLLEGSYGDRDIGNTDLLFHYRF